MCIDGSFSLYRMYAFVVMFALLLVSISIVSCMIVCCTRFVWGGLVGWLVLCCLCVDTYVGLGCFFFVDDDDDDDSFSLFSWSVCERERRRRDIVTSKALFARYFIEE